KTYVRETRGHPRRHWAAGTGALPLWRPRTSQKTVTAPVKTSTGTGPNWCMREIGRASCRGRGDDRRGAGSRKAADETRVEVSAGTPDSFFASGRRHTSFSRDWSSDVCSSDLKTYVRETRGHPRRHWAAGTGALPLWRPRTSQKTVTAPVKTSTGTGPNWCMR